MGERCALRTLEDVEFSMPLFFGGGQVEARSEQAKLHLRIACGFPGQSCATVVKVYQCISPGSISRLTTVSGYAYQLRALRSGRPLAAQRQQLPLLPSGFGDSDQGVGGLC